MLSHAFFKALLFLGAGAVIHSVRSNRMSDMGGLRRAMPVTFATMTIGLLALVGVFPLAGFFSKESILVAADQAAHGESSLSPGLGWLVLLTCLVTIAVTTAYVYRLWSLTFLGVRRSPVAVHEAPAGMRWPLVALAVPTAVFGLVGLSVRWLPTWLGPFGEATGDAAPSLSPSAVTVALSASAVLLGGAFAWVATRRSVDGDASQLMGNLRPAVAGGLGVDVVYGWVAVAPFRAAVRTVRVIDDRVVTRIVHGTGRLALALGRAAQEMQQGDVQRYLSASLTAVVCAVVVILVAVAQ